MEVLEAIKARRSIRKYKPTPVDDKVLGLILEAARLAPSWGNTQCWRFVVVSDDDTRNRLADTLNPTNPVMDALRRQAPLVIVACAKLGESGFSNGEKATDKNEWFMFDVALAMEHLVLAAHSLGLATVYVGRFDAKKVAEILAVPQGYRAVAMTPLGYPDQVRDPRPRKELSEIIFYNRFGVGIENSS